MSRLAIIAFLVVCWKVGAAEPALTVYNKNFAVVRELVPIDLKGGTTTVTFAGATRRLEPSSVILRDPSGKTPFSILEQNYRNDPVSEARLLALHEGETIDFVVREPGKPERVVKGKIIRSGYRAPWSATLSRFQRAPLDPIEVGGSQPIILVDGRLQFTLPGQPVFAALGSDTILQPTLVWQIASEQPAHVEAELSYVTAGLSWVADYNIVAPETGDRLDVAGWVTIQNTSGKTYSSARLELIAGDVRKEAADDEEASGLAMARFAAAAAPNISEKAFDENHLYTLANPTTLLDNEMKQVEFIRAAGVASQRIYIYDGMATDRMNRADPERIRQDAEYGTSASSKVWVMRELRNSAENHLGLPLPAGRVRFYRKNGDQLEFVGENRIDHTPRDETLRLYTGDAFDLVGARRRIKYRQDSANHWADESFEITLHNHKAEPVEIRVVEHLYRGSNWTIRQTSNTYLQNGAQTIEFRLPLHPGEEKTVSYEVHYTW